MAASLWGGGGGGGGVCGGVFGVHGGEGLISGFRGFSASISKICAFIPFHLKMGVLLILAGGLALGYHSIGFRHFPHIS